MSVLATILAIPRWVHIAAGILALCLAALTLHKCSVRDAVKSDRAATQAQVTTKALSAERAANASDATRQADIQANDQSTRKAINDAVSAHPETVPAGVATRAAADSLRARSTGGSASTR